MVDLKAGYPEVREEIDKAVKTILDKTNFILGEEVAKFEAEFAAYCGVKHAVGVANGTDALKIAVMACGINKGDEVITTPFTFIATTEAIVQAGAVPVFADIDLDTYTISSKEIEKKITKKTRAILPVHLYGHPADMDAVMKIAAKHNLMVIEDCAQSFTAKYNGKVTGSIGKAGCYSFFPAKNLGCFGDGGMVVTNDKDTFENAKALRNHGQKVKYFSSMDGFNSRLDTLQAAILSVRLKYIDKWTKMRNAVAAKYAERLKGAVVTPVVKPNCLHSFNYYNLLFKNKTQRDNVQKALSDAGVASQIYYPRSLHLQEVYGPLGYKAGDFPVSEKCQDETLSLPMYPELNDEQVEYICAALKKSV